MDNREMDKKELLPDELENVTGGGTLSNLLREMTSKYKGPEPTEEDLATEEQQHTGWPRIKSVGKQKRSTIG